MAEDGLSGSQPEDNAVSSGSQGDNNASTSKTIAATAPKKPPPERPEDTRRRLLVITSFWILIIVLGLPIWRWTTSIYRAKLPLQEMMEWADGKVSYSPIVILDNVRSKLMRDDRRVDWNSHCRYMSKHQAFRNRKHSILFD